MAQSFNFHRQNTHIFTNFINILLHFNCRPFHFQPVLRQERGAREKREKERWGNENTGEMRSALESHKQSQVTEDFRQANFVLVVSANTAFLGSRRKLV